MASNAASPLNPALVSSLATQLAQLIEAAGLPSVKEEDADARSAKVEVNKIALNLRNSLATLKTQAQQLPAGNMSVDDQVWLLAKLEDELKVKKGEVEALAKLVPSEDVMFKPKDSMDLD